MTTYVYETITQQPGEKPRYFEIKQRMNDQPLTKHPETGEMIRRVILGGYGTLSSKPGAGEKKDAGSSCCGPSCCCG